MRTIVHLSDLHFGRIDSALLEPLRRWVQQLAPDVVVVSGDLTQRARAEEFRAARRYLDTLPSPQIVVPGNHDVPLYNPYQRFFQPLHKYRRLISPDLEPVFVDAEIAIAGINTARSLTFKGGRINEQQLERVRARLCHLPDSVAKIIVTHHPFDLPDAAAGEQIVGRARMAMRMFAHCGADILLAGHLHASHAGNTTERYRIEGFSALVVQAGTATSTRGRGEANSFNALRIDSQAVRVERFEWKLEPADFALAGIEDFEHTPNGWVEKTSPP